MDPLTTTDFILIALAAVAAGAINALAGGGTLVTFPTLTWVGISPISANVTNTVGLFPGYLSATYAQFNDIKGQIKRLYYLAPAAVLGGLTGGLLLLNTKEKLFSQLVPFLILLACLLLAVQEPLRKWLVRRSSARGHAHISEYWAVPLIYVAGIYGGYFGAGLSVIVLAVLGVIFDDSLTRLNGLKQSIAFFVNIAAALFFVFSEKVVWPAVIVMWVGATVGGLLGGKLAGRIKPTSLRWLVVTVGVVVAVIFFFRL